LHFRRRKFSQKIEFNVVARRARFIRQSDSFYARRISIVGEFEFIMLGHDAQQAMNLEKKRKVRVVEPNYFMSRHREVTLTLNTQTATSNAMSHGNFSGCHRLRKSKVI
jgi:hypothetical protein